MLAPADTDRLLDLLREAGDEAVTLDELAVVGVQDPASALLSLELAGFGVERIYERAGTGTRTCVRLRAQVDPSPVQFMEPQPARDHRKAATFGVLALLLLLIARR